MTAKERVQGKIQKEAYKAWVKGKHWGMLNLGTGVGKSKIAVDAVAALLKKDEAANILLVVPTENLRDNNWKDEFEKWGQLEAYHKIEKYCYASIKKLEDMDLDLVIMDEVHNLSELNSQFFDKNKIDKLLGLTATAPNLNGTESDKIKVQIFNRFKIKSDYVYTIEDAKEAGIVSDYKLVVVTTNLDDTDKYIEAGNKANRFLQTETQKYAYLSKLIMSNMDIKAKTFKMLERLRLVANSISKEKVVNQLLTKHTGDRILVFGGSVAQIDKLLAPNVYHGMSGSRGQQALNDFKEGKIDVLGCVEGLNEGANIPNLDVGIIVQVNSNARKLIQRVGRLIRHRPNHTSIIYIILCMGTQDEKWLKKALEDFNPNDITYIHSRSL